MVCGERLGVVVGTSLANVDLLGDAQHSVIDTAFGSVPVVDIGDALIVRRHGDPHLPAHLVDHRRNVAALATAGCDRVLALASVGSLGRDPVGAVVCPDDFVALRAYDSYFTDVRGHSVPAFTPWWRAGVLDAWGPPVIDGGVYVQTPGPRFETPAEVRVLATMGDLVGMTLANECVLAGEVGLAYAAVCTVDNLANGIGGLLTVEVFESAVRDHQSALVAMLRAAITRLADTPLAQ